MTDAVKGAHQRIEYFLEAWAHNGFGDRIVTVGDSPGTHVAITVEDLRTLLDSPRDKAIAESMPMLFPGTLAEFDPEPRLRDEIAMRVLQGAIAFDGMARKDGLIDAEASNAYAYADAMLKARKAEV